MGGLFGGGTASKYQKKQQNYVDQQQRALDSSLNPKSALQSLNNLAKTTTSAPFVSSQSGSYYTDFNPQNGTTDLERTPWLQGVVDRIGTDQNTADKSFFDLLQQITPGFGKLTNERDRALALQQRAAGQDLRSQLSKRRVLGASFAQDQLESQRREYDRMRDSARAESIVAELDMTRQVIQQRADTALNYTKTALQHAQFEGALQSNNMATMQNNMIKVKDLQIDIAKMIASITSSMQIASAEIRAGLASQVAGSFGQFAALESQEQAGVGNFIGSVLGLGSSLATGGIGGLPGFGNSGGLK